MTTPPFVHLHAHTTFSALDGMSSVSSLVNRAVEFGMPAVAVTDHGTAGGLMRLGRECRAAGVKPIYGVEFYHARDRRTRRRRKGEKPNNHLTALATSTAGYRGLLALSAMANKEGRYGKWPRIDDELLDRYGRDGLVLTSGCMGSIVSQHLMEGQFDEAVAQAAKHRDIVGRDRYFIEIMRHGFEEQDRLIGEQLRLAKALDAPLVATNDSHYTDAGDADAHDMLLCIQTKKALGDRDRLRFASQEFFYKSPRQMWELFPADEFPGACENTLLIADMVDDDIAVSTPDHLLPTFAIPDDERGREAVDAARRDGVTVSDAYLRLMVEGNARRRRFYGASGEIPDAVRERIDHELDVIADMGFADYFLILADIVQWAKSHGVLVGPARGSAAGSIVAYLSEITAVDPLAYGLMFERFLNPARREMPDIDVDFDPARVHEVIAYARRTYGQDNVGLIGTYQFLKAKNAIKDAARVLRVPPSKADEMSKLIPDDVAVKWHGTLSDMLAEEPGEHVRTHPDQLDMWRSLDALRSRYRDVPRPEEGMYAPDRVLGPDGQRRMEAEAMRRAQKIEGVIRQSGEHAAGVLISPSPLWESVPVRSRRDAADGGANADMLVSEYDMKDVVDAGLVKYDFLRIKNLPSIRRALDLIEQTTGQAVDLDRIPLDDAATYRMLARGETAGVFQLESDGCTKFVADLKPRAFEHLYAVLAIYRPGPLGADVHKSFARRLSGREKVTILEPSLHASMTQAQRDALSPVLAETLGLLVYQEQVMTISQVVAGYSASEADNFRKIIGKKNLDLLEGLHDDFVTRAVDGGWSERFVNRLWEIILPFSSYCFNKSHAVGYGMVSYWTAWLKANYPAQFTAACIDFLAEGRRPAQVASATALGLDVLPPDINVSSALSTCEPGTVFTGLRVVKGLGDTGVAAILEERGAGGRFLSLPDFARRMVRRGGVSMANTLSLIKCGAFDGLHPSRCEMANALPDIWSAAAASKKAPSGMGLLGAQWQRENMPDEWPLDGRVADWSARDRRVHEIEVLRFTVGQHPCAALRGNLPDGVVMAGDAVEGDAAVAGLVVDVVTKTSASGKPFTKFTLVPDHGPSLSCIAFMELDPGLRGETVIARGEVVEDDFADDGGLIARCRSVEPYAPAETPRRRAPRDTGDDDATPARAARPPVRRAARVTPAELEAPGDDDAAGAIIVRVDDPGDVIPVVAALLDHGTDGDGRDAVVECRGERIEMPLRVAHPLAVLRKAIPVATINCE